jgi:hypothetical protein
MALHNNLHWPSYKLGQLEDVCSNIIDGKGIA